MLTESGLHSAAAMATRFSGGNLQVEQVSGRLYDRLQIGKLHWQGGTTKVEATGISLSWSPDGSRIAFDGNEGPNPGCRQLGVAEVGGDPQGRIMGQRALARGDGGGDGIIRHDGQCGGGQDPDAPAVHREVVTLFAQSGIRRLERQLEQTRLVATLDALFDAGLIAFASFSMAESLAGTRGSFNPCTTSSGPPRVCAPTLVFASSATTPA
mgnify:CR=1 FL=1